MLSESEARDAIIVALDCDRRKALFLAETLEGRARWVKVVNKFLESIKNFEAVPDQYKSENMSTSSDAYFMEILDYAYEHLDEFRLLLCSSAGTKYENFIHDLVEKEISCTHDFLNVLKKLGHDIKSFDPVFEHIMISGMFSSFFETIIHDMPKEQAIRCAKELHSFYTYGWMGIMNL